MLREKIEGNQKEFFTHILRYCYEYDEEDLEDAEKQFDIARGEAMAVSGTFSEIKEHIQWELKTKGRKFVLTAILGQMYHLIGYENRHKVLTMVEISEVEEHTDNRRPLEAIIRFCSYLDNLLKEENNESDSKLYYRIQTASDEELFTEEQEKLAQFIRDVRNDASHNFWIETEMSYAIHDFAAISSITFLEKLLHQIGVTKWHVESRISIENALRVIEEEFEFDWDPDEREWCNGPREKYVHIVEWEDPE
ncbi:hypothetical protein A4G99_12505 [Haladaptatus sp. R4]|nr:hypothetical protein A4G99_12505 [Haladaptatus sp. R4]